tara:strand:+ start:82 stop:357 length:276 start_codon:yes stop_codon:yes gene_type:complete
MIEEEEDDTMESIYQYPATCTKFDKEGNITSSRIVTRSAKGTQELHSLYPDLNKVIKRFDKENKRRKKKSTTTNPMFPDPKVWLMWYQLGK